MCNFHQLYQIMKISIYQKKSYEKPIFHKKKCIFFWYPILVKLDMQLNPLYVNPTCLTNSISHYFLTYDFGKA